MSKVKMKVIKDDHFMWGTVPPEFDTGIELEVPASLKVRFEYLWDLMSKVQEEIRVEVEKHINENRNSRK